MDSERYYFIVNPAANTGRLRKRWESLNKIITEHISSDNYDFVFTSHPLNGIELTKNAIAEGKYSHIVSVGGDGIANEVVNALMVVDHDVTFGMIPAGTSNDGHQTHNFPLDPEEAIPLLFENHIETFAIGKISGDFGDKPHYFFDHCDTGLAAMSARDGRGSRFRGEWKYTWYALKNLVRFKSNSGTVIVDGEEYEGDFAVVGAGFGQDMSGYHLWPGNSNRSGDFGVIMARNLGRFGLLKLMLAAENGNHIGREGVIYRRGKKIEINLELPWPYQAEGEIFTDATKKSTMEHIDKALKIVTVPEDS